MVWRGWYVELVFDYTGSPVHWVLIFALHRNVVPMMIRYMLPLQPLLVFVVQSVCHITAKRVLPHPGRRCRGKRAIRVS